MIIDIMTRILMTNSNLRFLWEVFFKIFSTLTKIMKLFNHPLENIYGTYIGTLLICIRNAFH